MTHLWEKHINARPKWAFFGQVWCLRLIDAKVDGRRFWECRYFSDPEAITHRTRFLVTGTLGSQHIHSLFLTSNTLLKWFSLNSDRDWQQKIGSEHTWKCVYYSSGMTNLSASALLLSSLAWSFNPHICMAKDRSAPLTFTLDVNSRNINGCCDCVLKMLIKHSWARSFSVCASQALPVYYTARW